MFFEALPSGQVQCTLCPLYCRISPGRRGACGVRVNLRQVLYTLVHRRVVARHIDPIEKKPLFHFYPGSGSYSVATVGCNFRCHHCQNAEISQQPKGRQPPVTLCDADTCETVQRIVERMEADIPGEPITPDDIVRAASRARCRSIAYTYTEPTIFFELAYETARRAAAAGIANVFVTNGSITEQALACIAPYLDAANIDLKGFDEARHQRMTGAPLQPVLESIRAYRRLGIWIEITTLLVPGFNDSDFELRRIAEFIASVGADIPWHVTRFYPTYRLRDRPPTPVATLRRARDIGYRAGLQYVYEGNIAGLEGEQTYCHACRSPIVQRYAHALVETRIRQGHCPDCGARIPGVWDRDSPQPLGPSR